LNDFYHFFSFCRLLLVHIKCVFEKKAVFGRTYPQTLKIR